MSHVNVILPDEKGDSLRSDVVETENLEKDPKGSNDENKNSFHIEEGEKEKESEADEMKGDNMKNMEPATNKITGSGNFIIFYYHCALCLDISSQQMMSMMMKCIILSVNHITSNILL